MSLTLCVTFDPFMLSVLVLVLKASVLCRHQPLSFSFIILVKVNSESSLIVELYWVDSLMLAIANIR